MTMAETSARLTELLGNHSVKVIALSGKWGTGKTYMWQQAAKECPDVCVSDAVATSIFGIGSINELKLKLLDRVVKFKGGKERLQQEIKDTGKAIAKFAASVFKAGAVVDELALLTVPRMLQGKFLVIDDIERKHEKLSIDELLGFIDEFSSQYGCRFLLVLNADELKDLSLWHRFREKVIDEEVRLKTTPAEAFDISIKTSVPVYAEQLRSATEACEITNVRIIRKVIRVVESLIPSIPLLNSDVVARTVPSTVLLTATAFGGLEEGPTLDWIMGYDGGISYDMANQSTKKEMDESENGKNAARWRLLLNELGVHGIDDYEKVVHTYLEAGLIDKTAIQKVFDDYISTSNKAAVQNKSYAFFDVTTWNPDMPDHAAVSLGRELLDDINLLSCYSISGVVERLGRYQGGPDLAKAMLDKWISQLESLASQADATAEQFVLDNWTGQKVHPDIEAAFNRIRLGLKKPRGLLEVLKHLFARNGWGEDERAVLRAATAEQIFECLATYSGDDLKYFMAKSVDYYKHSGTYDVHFGSYTQNFLDACKRLVAVDGSSRRAELVIEIFRSDGMIADLQIEPPSP